MSWVVDLAMRAKFSLDILVAQYPHLSRQVLSMRAQ